MSWILILPLRTCRRTTNWATKTRPPRRTRIMPSQPRLDVGPAPVDGVLIPNTPPVGVEVAGLTPPLGVGVDVEVEVAGLTPPVGVGVDVGVEVAGLTPPVGVGVDVGVGVGVEGVLTVTISLPQAEFADRLFASPE